MNGALLKHAAEQPTGILILIWLFLFVATLLYDIIDGLSLRDHFPVKVELKFYILSVLLDQLL